MTTECIPTSSGVMQCPPTAKSRPGVNSLVSQQRAPTDPLYYSDVVIKNMVVGSRYWLVPDNDHATVLASGVAASSEFTLSGIPAYVNPQLLLLRVRYSSAATRYLPLNMYAEQGLSGVTFYVSQVEDTIAQ